MHHLFIFLCVFSSGNLLAAPRPVSLATGEVYSSVIDWKSPNGGPLTENIRRIFQHMGYGPTIEFMPWKRAYSETLKATYDATFPWYRDPEREAEFLFSDSLYEVPLVGVVRSSSAFQRLDFLTMRNKTSCDLLGSKAYEFLVEKSSIKIIYVKEYSQCYQMLFNGRIDFLFVHRETAEANLKYGIRIVPDVLKYTLSLHLMISRKHKEAKTLLAAFNSSLHKLRDAGALIQLLPKESMKP